MNVPCGHRIDSYCLLHESVKQLASRTGGSAVEPERKFVKVVIQMRSLHTTLISSQQPPFEQCNNAVHLRQQVSTDSSLFSDNFVCVALFGQSYIPFPSIRLDGAPRFHTFLYSPLQAMSRRIRYTPEPNPSDIAFFNLYHNNDQRLTRCSSTPLPWFFTTHVYLIYLNRSRQTISSRSHHRAPELVQPRPCSLIAAQIKNTLQSQRVRSIFLTGQMPDSVKPEAQRFFGVLKMVPAVTEAWKPQ